jgi:hypothetical protein
MPIQGVAGSNPAVGFAQDPHNQAISGASEQARQSWTSGENAPWGASSTARSSQRADESALYHHYELNYTPPSTESGRRLARR